MLNDEQFHNLSGMAPIYSSFKKSAVSWLQLYEHGFQNCKGRQFYPHLKKTVKLQRLAVAWGQVYAGSCLKCKIFLSNKTDIMKSNYVP